MKISPKNLYSFTGLTTLTAEHLKNYLKRTNNFEQNLNSLKILSLDKGNCVAELEVEKHQTNILGTLHGGFTATLVDVVSSYGLNSIEQGNMAHVSVNMNIRYLKAAQMGKTILIESEMVKCGKNLAFLEVSIKDKESGSIIAKGEHIKYLLNAS